MSHSIDTPLAKTAPPDNAVLAWAVRVFSAINHGIMHGCMLALVLTSCVLTYSVVTRYFFKASNDWQDELSVFMLVGATFLSCAFVQSQRGHIGIEAVASLLPERVNRVRLALVDVLSLVFCLFFSWKSWTLFYEAWTEGQTTSSSFAPPLWIPYAMMAAGMSLLSLQLMLQSVLHLSGAKRQGEQT